MDVSRSYLRKKVGAGAEMNYSTHWGRFFRQIAIVGKLSCALSAHAFIFELSPPPNSADINFSETGVVADFRFKAKKQYSYVYFLKFSYPKNDQQEKSRIKKLMGGHAVDKFGNLTDPGVPMSLDLRVFAICPSGKEIEILSIKSNPALTSWGDGYFTKSIGNHILDPGEYRVRLINEKAYPDFSSNQVTFEVGMPAKINTKSNTRIQPCQHQH